MRRFCTAVLAIFGLVAVAQLSPSPAHAAKSSEPIKIAITESVGQRISAHVAGEALRRADYKVEYVAVDAGRQFEEIAQGNIHAQPEVWTDTAGETYGATVASGDVIVLGPLGLQQKSVVKVAWKLMEKKWPGAVKMLRSMNLSSTHRDAMIVEIEARGRDLEEVVSEWMATNRKTWKRWNASVGNWILGHSPGQPGPDCRLD